jgi:hypothetical protein
MTKIASFSLTALTVTALLASVGYVQPQWAAGLGMDFWNLPELHRRLDRAYEETAELDRRAGILLRRIDAKERITDELIAGRMKLEKALPRFRELNDTPADFPNHYREFYPASSAEESVCLQLLSWVRNSMDERPLLREEVMARLEAEKEELFCCPGATPSP